MSNLGKAIQWKYGNASRAHCNLETEVIISWGHPTEPQPDVPTLLAEYQVYKDAQDAADAAKQAELDLIRNDNAVKDLISKSPGQLDTEISAMNSVPEIRAVVRELAKQVKLLTEG